jgi:CBS domain containing-hemolysin-like protein
MRLDQAAPVVGGWGGSPETVASHIVIVLGRFPEPGEQVSIDGLDVEIEVVEAGHIGSVIVGRPAEAPEPAE